MHSLCEQRPGLRDTGAYLASAVRIDRVGLRSSQPPHREAAPWGGHGAQGWTPVAGYGTHRRQAPTTPLQKHFLLLTLATFKIPECSSKAGQFHCRF